MIYPAEWNLVVEIRDGLMDQTFYGELIKKSERLMGHLTKSMGYHGIMWDVACQKIKEF
jgi:hypothetical protein